jgi:hypothetical protein
MKIPGPAPRPVQLHRWLARAIVAIVVGLIPWTAYLAWSLPGHFRAHNWRLAWVGFDAALIAVLAYTAWAAWARRQILAPTAIVAATMLICDAWFDVNTSFGTRGEALAIVTALGGNLPLALVFILLARQIMLRSAAILAEARGVHDRPRHARDVTMPFAATWHDEAPASFPDHHGHPPGPDLQHHPDDDAVVPGVLPQPGSPPRPPSPQGAPVVSSPGEQHDGGPARTKRSDDG